MQLSQMRKNKRNIQLCKLPIQRSNCIFLLNSDKFWFFSVICFYLIQKNNLSGLIQQIRLWRVHAPCQTWLKKKSRANVARLKVKHPLGATLKTPYDFRVAQSNSKDSPNWVCLAYFFTVAGLLQSENSNPETDSLDNGISSIHLQDAYQFWLL